MSFTNQELANISAALLDFHVTGDAMSQVIQERPLMNDLFAAQKKFPGGKENITYNVKGVYTTRLQGFTHDDTVTYQNPANIKQATVPWKEVHAGISMTLTELKKAGISVVDSTTGEDVSRHSGREKFVITDLLNDKIEDMMEGWARDFQSMLWRDGTLSSKLVPGVRSFLLDSPSSAGSTMGIDRVANSWWRNYASIGINAATPSNQNLVNALQIGLRQIRRYGGRPKNFYAGSDFINALEKEVRDKGYYSDSGFMSKGKTDAGMADISFKNIPVQYDPTLDDEGMSKYGFLIDLKHTYLKVMEGEDRKTHAPARPEDKYVLYRSMTWTGGLCCDQLNANGVFSIA